MSAPTPLSDLELLRELCRHADSTLARAEYQIDRLSAELAATKSCLAAANERVESVETTIADTAARFRELDKVLHGCMESIPEVDRWAASGPLILLRRLLSVEAPRAKAAVGPRLVVP